MRYKVGDKVVLSDKKGVKEEFKGKEAEIIEPPRVVSLIGKDYAFKVEGRSRMAYGSYDDIDHEKTAELQKKDKTLEHYQGELEKVVAEKNKVELDDRISCSEHAAKQLYGKNEKEIEHKQEVGALDKRVNLYKSTIGQINKLIEDTYDDEAIEHLEKAKEYVARGFVTENRAIFKRFFSALGEAFQTIGEMIGGLFDD